jgi:hypothetical protein
MNTRGARATPAANRVVRWFLLDVGVVCQRRYVVLPTQTLCISCEARAAATRVRRELATEVMGGMYTCAEGRAHADDQQVLLAHSQRCVES